MMPQWVFLIFGQLAVQPVFRLAAALMTFGRVAALLASGRVGVTSIWTSGGLTSIWTNGGLLTFGPAVARRRYLITSIHSSSNELT